MLRLIISMRRLVIGMIILYQKTLSPDHGIFRHAKPYGHCRFRPTCSEYAITAIEKYGIIRGGAKAVWRVLRCNPFNQGGYDPVDKEKDNKLENNR
ncbi:MAG: membrane protein insertion efficiency factor YidD [bacterium]